MISGNEANYVNEILNFSEASYSSFHELDLYNDTLKDSIWYFHLNPKSKIGLKSE